MYTKEQWAEYRKKNREKFRENDRRWRERNPERAKELANFRSKEYYRRNEEARKEYAKKYREENPEKVKSSLLSWEERNKDHRKAYKKKYREENKETVARHRKQNPDMYKAYKAKRRTKETQAGGHFNPEEWFTLCFAVGFKCLCCGEKLPLTPDHVVPVSKGGSSWLFNIQPLCGPCNYSKGANIVEYRWDTGEYNVLANNQPSGPIQW